MESGGCLVVPAVFKTVERWSSHLWCVRFAPSPPLPISVVLTLFTVIYASRIRLFCANNNLSSFVTDYPSPVKKAILNLYLLWHE